MAIGAGWAEGSFVDAAFAVGAWATAGANPAFVSASIATDGNSISIIFDEAVTFGAGGNSGIVITPSGGASTATYSSGDTTATLVYTLSRTIDYGEIITLAYTQPGNGIEAVDDAADVATFSGESVANGSTVNFTSAIAPLLLLIA